MAGGRPSKFSKDLIEAIVERLSTGEPMAKICRDEGMPAYRTVLSWMNEKDESGTQTERGAYVSALIARAREEGFDRLAEQCLEIADDGTRDYGTREDGTAFVDHDHIQRSKLRIDTRLKLLAKWDPKRYGEKIQHADADGNNLPAPQFVIQPVVSKS